jgi:hypothetical protein
LPSLRFLAQSHLHEDIGTAIGHWRKSFRFHVTKPDRFVQVNSIPKARIAAEEQRNTALPFQRGEEKIAEVNKTDSARRWVGSEDTALVP